MAYDLMVAGASLAAAFISGLAIGIGRYRDLWLAASSDVGKFLAQRDEARMRERSWRELADNLATQVGELRRNQQPRDTTTGRMMPKQAARG